jgi:hypothetical protein
MFKPIRDEVNQRPSGKKFCLKSRAHLIIFPLNFVTFYRCADEMEGRREEGMEVVKSKWWVKEGSGEGGERGGRSRAR